MIMVNGNLAYKQDAVTRPIKVKNTGRRPSYYGSYATTASQRGNMQRGYASSYASAYYAQRAKAPVQNQQTVKKVEKDRREMIHRKLTLLRIVYMGIIALSAAFMISKFVAVNETAGEIKRLNNELDSMRAYTSQRVFELEQSIDLSEVEEIATTRLGMQRPESYQIIYVNVDKNDISEVTAGDVEGAKNDVKSFAGKIKENIMELFGIK